MNKPTADNAVTVGDEATLTDEQFKELMQQVSDPDDEQESVPVEDPQPDAPQMISFTPVSLFLANFTQVYDGFKLAQRSTTAKLQNDQFLVAEAAKYAHALLGIQLSGVGR